MRKLTVKASAAPQGHTQMKVTDVAVSTPWILVLSPLDLAITPRIVLLLDGRRSKDPCEELWYGSQQRYSKAESHRHI